MPHVLAPAQGGGRPARRLTGAAPEPATRARRNPQPGVGPAPAVGSPRGWLARHWPALVPALVLAVVYGCTVQRSTGNAFSIDTTKFEYVGLVLGTPHPPGYPLYTLLNAAAVRLPVGSPALLANVASAVFALLACVVAVPLLRGLGLPRPLQAGGATALGLLPALWENAVVAEVYSLTALFMVGVLSCVVRYEVSRRRAWLRGGLLLFALSFAHATSHVLLVPGLLVYLGLRRPNWLLRPRELLTLLPAGAALALLPYAYLPWRTAVGGDTWLETQVRDPHSLWAAMTGAQFGNRMFEVPEEVVHDERLPQLVTAATGQLGPLLVLAGVGLAVLVWRRPVLAALTVVWAGCVAAFVLTYDVADWLTLLLPLWLVLALWALVGLDAGLRLVRGWRRPVAVLLGVALPLTAALTGWTAADRSGFDPQRQVDAAVAALPDRSLVFTADLEVRQQFVYRLLPDGLGTRRQVWASQGPDQPGGGEHLVGALRTYCAPLPGPWLWPWHEQPAATSVPRDLAVFVYGDGYARDVAAQGYRVDHVEGQLYATACRPGEPSATNGTGLRPSVR